MIGKMFIWIFLGLIVNIIIVSVVRDNNIAVGLVSYLIGFFTCLTFAFTHRDQND
jgi:NhaP-type Na+/H+ and K+/H+ antiporter|tara:strand:+ start:714 stop:878 length:165 start_codon:yes stop_codon:yes gene_type:complete